MSRFRATTSLATAVAVTLLVARAAAGPPTVAAAPVTVEATLTIATRLPAAARSALIDEAQTIWRHAGVRLRLIEDRSQPPLPLRILVVDQPATAPGGQWVAGELLRAPDERAIALASIARAEAIVSAAGVGHVRLEPNALVHHRLGVVLGRAVAHEIGHYLLGTGEHSGAGLMRATIGPREFADLRSGAFTVDKALRQRIQDRLARRGRL